MKKQKNINIKTDENLEQIEEDIIKAADKAGKKNVIVNIFTYPHKKLKKRWHVRYKFNKKHLVLDLVIAGIVALLIGLNIFWFMGGFHYFSNNLQINIKNNSEQVVSGQEIEFVIDYKNANKYKIQQAVLSLHLPENFKLINVNNEKFNYEHNILQLGDLESGANGSLLVEGQTFGEFNSEENFSTHISYFKTDKKGDRLWGQFQNIKNLKYSIANSYIKVESNLPDALVNQQIVNWQIKLKNESPDITYSKIKIEPVYDDEFLAVKKGELFIENFKPNQEEQITIVGKLNSKNKVKNLTLKIYWQENEFTLLQNDLKFELPIIDPQFSVSSKFEKNIYNLGEYVPLQINFANNGEFTIENLEVYVDFIGDYWDLPNSKTEYGWLAGNRFTFSYKADPHLQLIQPKQNSSFSFEPKIKNIFIANEKSDLRYVVSYRFKVDGQTVEISNPIKTIKLNSNLSASVYPMYFAVTGDQLGRGPLPARVGQETKYWVFAKIINDINDVDNVQISASLPANVSWTGNSNVPVGDQIEFNNNELVWKISKAPAQTSNLGFAFEVKIVPTLEQLNTYPVLLSNIKISGTDKITGKFLQKNISAINTKLNFDKKGLLKDGVVR